MQNRNVTLVDVRNHAINTLEGILDGSIEIEKAKQVKGLLDTIINSSKTQVDFINSIPKNIKENMNFDELMQISGSFRDDNYELDKTLKHIEEKNKQPYIINNK